MLSQTPMKQSLSCGSALKLCLFNIFFLSFTSEMEQISMISFSLVKLVVKFNHVMQILFKSTESILRLIMCNVAQIKKKIINLFVEQSHSI